MIIFPMGGENRRFTEAGYTKPKYMLEVGAYTAFDLSIAGFLDSYRDREFVFIHRNAPGIREFIEARLAALNVTKHRLVELTRPTSGQAETVERALVGPQPPYRGPITIFNIDTFRQNVRDYRDFELGDGCLEVFRGAGANWSFVDPRPDTADQVARTTEKLPVSDLCCTGLYYFKSADDFLFALSRERITPSTDLGETYVAPIYNHLIQNGQDIRYTVINREDVIFCGVPGEYEHIIGDVEQISSLSRALVAHSPRM